MAIIFTCTKCETRSAKKFTEQAYKSGVVLVRCPGCEGLHLIADRLGFFGDKGDGGWDVERFLEEKGETVKAVHEGNVLEITMADILGGTVDGEGNMVLTKNEKDEKDEEEKR